MKITAFLALSISCLQISCFGQDQMISDCSCATWDNWREVEGVSCHYLTVPEDHNEANGKQIQIAFAVFSAHGEAEGHPTFYLTGGPGGRSLNSIDRWLSHSLRETGDLIVVEQRGIGLSSPLPSVSERTFEILAADLTSDEEKALTRTLMRTLASEFDEAGIDVSKYNSTQNAHDFGKLMQALDYERYNLYGSSYGTRLAAGIMREYPDLLNAAILNGPANLDGKALEGRFPNLIRSIEKLYDACANDPACNNSYPDLKAAFIEGLAKLATEPMVVQASGSTYIINPQDAIYLLRYLLYRSTGFETAPPFIYALRNRDLPTVERLVQGPMQFVKGPGISVFYAFQAYEELSDQTVSNVQKVMTSAPELEHGLAWFQAFIPHLGELSGERASTEEQTFRNIRVPALVIVNEFDPVTPPHHTSMFEEAITHCQVIRLNQFGHGSDNACLREITRDFLINPQAGIDRSCLD